MVEWGRMVIDPEYRGGDRGVLMGLGARGWLAMRGLGFTVAIGATPVSLVELFDSLGLGVTVVGPSQLHWGEERCLIVCEGRLAIPGIERVYLHQQR